MILSEMFGIGAVIVAFLWAILAALRRKKWVDGINKIPGLKSVPLFGNLFQMRIISLFSNPKVNPLTAVLQFREGLRVLFPHEAIVRIWVGLRPSVMLYKPSAVECLLSSNKSINKGFFYKMLHPWLGEGLLTSSGEKWKKKRKLLTPAFHFRILYDFIPIMNEYANQITQKISTEQPVDVVPLISLCTLDIICETAMGVQVNAQENSESSYVASVRKISNLIMKRSAQPWLWNDSLYYLTNEGRKFRKCLQIVHHFTEKVIKERLATRKVQLEKSKRRLAFLDILVEEHLMNNGLSLADIREEVDTFMFEGHDTTAVGITWALYLIGLHKEVQAKIHNELDEIFSDSEKDIDYDDCSNMKYLECVIKESQRLYPSVPVLMRTLSEDTQIDKYLISKGTNVSIQVYAIHHDPEIYSSPEVFDPDRFLNDFSAKQHTFSYIPFSAGPRNCIGKRFAVLEEKIIIATVMRRYSLQSLQPRDKIKVVPEIVLRPVGKVNIQFTKRL